MLWALSTPCYHSSTLQLNTHALYVWFFTWCDVVVWWTQNVSWQQKFHVAPDMSALSGHHFGGYSKTHYKKIFIHAESHASTVCMPESGKQRYIKAINNHHHCPQMNHSSISILQMSWTRQSQDLQQATLTHLIPTKKLHSPVLRPQIHYTHQSQAHKWAGPTDLMRQLMAKDRNRRAHSASYAAGKCCPNGQTVTEIVDPITKYHHPGHCSHRAWDHVTVGMPVTMTVAVTVAVGVPQSR